MSELLRLADEYRRLGRRVMPLRADKKPLVRDYFGEDPYSEGQMWSQPWDQAKLIGVVLRQGEVALDTDCKDGKGGYEHRQLLIAEHGPLPATLSQRTRSGGMHELFSWNTQGAAYGRVMLPDGSWADIDVITSRYRYLVVHEPRWLLEDRREPTPLPLAWHSPVLRGYSRPMVHDGPRPARRSWATVTDLVTEVRDAEENRNNTVCAAVFTGVLHGFGSEAFLDEIREAALFSGLEESEVHSTVESALEAAALCWEASVGWLDPVVEWADTVGGSRGWQLKDVAYHFAILRAFKSSKRGPEIGMSQRDLAMRLGCGQKAAANGISSLVEAGFLRRVEKKKGLARNDFHASEFRLTVPNSEPERVTHSVVSTSGVMRYGQLLGSRIVLRTHPMFQRLNEKEVREESGWSGVLPRSALPVLLVLSELCTADLGELVSGTGLSRSTLRRVLKQLESHELIREWDGRYELVQDDFLEVLDDLASFLGVEDRSEWRRDKFEEDRRQRRRELEVWRTSDAYRDAKRSKSLAWSPTGEPYNKQTGEIFSFHVSAGSGEA